MKMTDRNKPRGEAAATAALLPRQTVDEAIGVLLAYHQGELVMGLRAALDRPMPETIQALRAALRRLRAALALSAGWCDENALDEILRDAQALFDALGETRQWDALIAGPLTRHVDELAGVADVAVLTEAAAAARHEGYRRVHVLLDGPLPQRLLLGLALLVSQQRWRGGANALSRRLAGSVRARAKRDIARLDKRARDRGKSLRRLSGEKRQDLAGDVRQLAEALELLAPLWHRTARTRRYRQRVQALQAALDGLQAAETALRLLDRIAEDDPSPVVQRAVGAIGGWSVRDRADRLAGLEKLWREFRSTKRFW